MIFLNSKRWKKRHFKQAAQILVNELRIGWPTIKEARKDVVRLHKDKEAYLIGSFTKDSLVGFVGYLQSYPTAFELHPLVVDKNFQKQGIGAQLVKKIEEEAKLAGAITMYLGTDDEGETPRTSLGNKDLFLDTFEHIASFEGGTHPASFYQKQGYKIVGVIPDANGLGRPDIYMAKKLYE